MNWEEHWASNQRTNFGIDSVSSGSTSPINIPPAVGAVIVLGSIYAASILGHKFLDKEGARHVHR